MKWPGVLLGLALATACGPAPARQEVEQSGHPTIVSLNPCADAVLAEVAAPGQLLAISHYSHDPRAASMDVARARQFPATGGTVEEVLALDPDVVVAGAFMPPAIRTALRNLGIRVETIAIANTVAESLGQVRDLARIAGQPQRGEDMVTQIERELARASPPAGPVSAVLWQPGGIVGGEGALVSELLQYTGFTRADAAKELGQADYLALEQVLADPPDLLLIAGSDRGQGHAALRHVPEMRVERYDPALLYCGGPTIARAADRLSGLRREMAP